MPHSFQQFLKTHPKYKAVYQALLHSNASSGAGRLLALSAQLVYRIHGQALGPVADDILTFVEHYYPTDYVDRYIARIEYLTALQRRFDQDPSPETLGDPDAHVDPDDYSLALLLSIVLTNHRFEIMAQLSAFLRSLGQRSPQGRLAAIGVGTGYELLLAARYLPHEWEIEAYETNDAIRNRAKQL
jgi:hypothetical protein